jgi:hypothetical protein
MLRVAIVLHGLPLDKKMKHRSHKEMMESHLSLESRGMNNRAKIRNG